MILVARLDICYVIPSYSWIARLKTPRAMPGVVISARTSNCPMYPFDYSPLRPISCIICSIIPWGSDIIQNYKTPEEDYS